MIAMPEAFHTATDDLPFADDWANTPGVRLKLLMADIEGARFAVRIRFAPGILLPPHSTRAKCTPLRVRAQGKKLPARFPIGGSMRYSKI